MPLSPGDRLGPYEILAPLGAGGMGEVYRARDTDLNRDVALKVLPDLVAADPDRLARFEREAQALAALNHPHIAQIYGIERGGGTRALVMELVEGEDLSRTVARGPVPIEDAIAVARQVADALEAAHECGIIHRDLKPANIMVRPDGTVKILDFGLAKALTNQSSANNLVETSPTFTSPAMTQVGVILGTAAYMAPEQARGKAVDRRADIWAFGCVLYEMLSGCRAFAGEDVTDLITAIVRDEPRWAALPAGAAPHVTTLLRRCLEKDPKRRLRDIGEARIALDSPASAPSEATSGPEGRRGMRFAHGLALGALLTIVAGGAAAAMWMRGDATPREPRVFEIVSGPDVRDPRVSFDGRAVAFVRSGRLFVRALDSLDAREIAGVDIASNPFWSPDGASIGYFARNELRVVPAGGGPSRLLADRAFPPFAAAWCRNQVAFIRWAAGIWVADEAGRVTELTPLDAARGESNFSYPSCLPDGRLLAVVDLADYRLASGAERSHIIVVDGARTSRIFGIPDENVAEPVFVPPDRIVFSRSGNRGLWSIAVGPDLSAVTGDPVLVQAGSRTPSVASDGLLVALSGLRSGDVWHEWVDRTGKPAGRVGKPFYGSSEPAIAPGGSRVAASGVANDRDEAGIWVLDPNGAQRLGDGQMLAWSPRGDQIVYAAGEDVYIRTVGDAAPRKLLTASVRTLCWTSDGRSVIYDTRGANREIRIQPVDGSAGPRVLVAGGEGPALSPDGRWLAYAASSGSRLDVYVRSFPDGKIVWPVTSEGGRHPRWSRTGELFFTAGPIVGTDPNSHRDLYTVTVNAADGQPSKPVMLFNADALGYSLTMRASRGYDVAPDGQRFIVRTRREQGEGVVTAIENVNAWLSRPRR